MDVVTAADDGTTVKTMVEVEYDESVKDIRSPELDNKMRQVARDLGGWANQARAAAGTSTMFSRGAYVSSENPLEQMRTARRAVENDDIVGGAADLTEGLALKQMKWQSPDDDDTDIFNQMATEQNLDGVIRSLWREDFSCSQAVMGFWWDKGTFTVRGKTKAGNARKKTVEVYYPRRITFLDSARVVPVGMLAFGQERLAWKASSLERQRLEQVRRGAVRDDVVERFYEGEYKAMDTQERADLAQLGVAASELVLLNDKFVRRYTSTKADYQRFSTVRLKSVFRLLDLKQQLMEADRVSLIGAANYILLVKKGDKDDPAEQPEVDNLRANFNYVAKLPVIFSDHRLVIEIISPKVDFTLVPEKYDTIDARIQARVMDMLTAMTSGPSGDMSLKRSRTVGAALENRRHMIRRFFEREIAHAVYTHPLNEGVFNYEPNLAFVPGRIQLDDDTGTAQAILELRTMKELSRDSTLEYFGFDQFVEATMREFEDERFDDIFKTEIPFNGTAGADAMAAPAEAAPAKKAAAPPIANAGAGRKGGRPKGGGRAAKGPARVARSGNGTTTPAPKGTGAK